MPAKPSPTFRRRLRQKLTHWADPVKPWLRKNVCVFHGGRVGSTVLGDLLNQHPRIHWASEVYWEDHARLHEAPIGTPFIPVNCPRRVMRQAMHRAGLRTFGAETQYGDLKMHGLTVESFLPWLTRNHFTHFIVQNRRNVLRQIVSGSVLRQRKKWRQVAGEPTQITRVTLDPDAVILYHERHGLVELIEQIQRWHDEAVDALRGRRVLTLIYEDDIEQDPRIAYRKTCDFLSLEPMDVTIRDVRMNPFPLPEMIENYDRVAAALRDTPHAWMLEG